MSPDPTQQPEPTDAGGPPEPSTANDAAPAEPATDDHRRLGLWLALAAFALLLLPATLVVVALTGGDDEPQLLTVVVPAGTGERIDRGEDVEILPPEVRLAVGDRMEVRNLDDRVHTVGPFTVRPGESILQVFGQAGTFEGDCTLLPGRKVTIVVT